MCWTNTNFTTNSKLTLDSFITLQLSTKHADSEEALDFAVDKVYLGDRGDNADSSSSEEYEADDESYNGKYT